MGQPPAYNKTRNFAAWQSANPGQIYSGTDFDTEFDNIEDTLDAINDNIALIQRDDGQLKNGVVTLDSLASNIFTLMAADVTFSGAWATSTAYVENEIVTQDARLYVCLIDHVSGSFSTDLGTAKWQLIGSSGAAADDVAFTPEAGVAAENVQAAIVEVAGDHTAHLADTVDAHDASAISYAGGTGMSATDVEAAIDELATEKANIADCPHVFEARLTLSSGDPQPSADQTAKTIVYLTPFKGNKIALHNGTSWALHTLTEKSVAVPSNTNTPFDIFVYDNAGTVTLEAVAWTNDTTRATALALQDGVWSKSGTLTRRYVGTGRTTGSSGQCESSKAKRFLWNYYNRLCLPIRVLESTDSWNYSTGTWRQANNSTANQLDFVIGIDEEIVEACVAGVMAANSTATARTVRIGIGLDSTTAFHSDSTPGSTLVTNVSADGIQQAVYRGFPGAGRHYLAWLEYGNGTDTQTWYGDAGAATLIQAGIIGSIRG